MENIYKEAIEQVSDGAKFRINLLKRNLMINGKYIIKDSQYDGELGVNPSDNVIEEIEHLYDRYNHSIPSERSDAQRRVYFRAKPEKDLDDDDMLYGERREEAQIALELYILCSLINGSLSWQKLSELDPRAKWFWQSKRYPSFIILKDWILAKENSTNN